MKCLAELSGIMLDIDGNDTLIQFHAAGDVRKDLEKFRGATVNLEVKKYRPKRSLDSNNYAWLLIDRIAKHPAIKSSKEEIYLHLLEQYGTFVYLPCVESKVEELKAVFRIVKDRGTIVLKTESGNLVICKQCQCYKGSSLMDQKEMGEFLDGVVYEAKMLGIETESPEEIERMKSQWNVSL
jgi:hypothetical protein